MRETAPLDRYDVSLETPAWRNACSIGCKVRDCVKCWRTQMPLAYHSGEHIHKQSDIDEVSLSLRLLLYHNLGLEEV